MINLVSINNTIEKIINANSKFSFYTSYKYLYGYYMNEQYYSDAINKLEDYLWVFKKLKEQLIFTGEACVSYDKIKSLNEQVNNIIGNNCNDIIPVIKIDNSREDDWVFKNPFCRSYESWEKWSKFYCGKLKLNLNIEEEKIPNLILEISREIINPDVLLSITAYKEANNLNLEINRTKEENKLDFKLLKEDLGELDLTEYNYSDLVLSFNLSYDIIKTIYSSGLSLEKKNNEVYLKTPMSSYKLNDLSDEVDFKFLEKLGLKTTTTIKNLLQDYKK